MHRYMMLFGITILFGHYRWFYHRSLGLQRSENCLVFSMASRSSFHFCSEASSSCVVVEYNDCYDLQSSLPGVWQALGLACQRSKIQISQNLFVIRWILKLFKVLNNFNFLLFCISIFQKLKVSIRQCLASNI